MHYLTTFLPYFAFNLYASLVLYLTSPCFHLRLLGFKVIFLLTFSSDYISFY